MADGSDGETSSTATRYRYTNDALAGVLVVFAVVLTGVYAARGESVPLWLATVDTIAIATAVAWAFGRGAFEAAAKAVGGGKD